MNNEELEFRKQLEKEFSQVWDTAEVQKDFEIISFLAPFCRAKRKNDGVEGTLCFSHRPRFYYDFVED